MPPVFCYRMKLFWQTDDGVGVQTGQLRAVLENYRTQLEQRRQQSIDSAAVEQQRMVRYCEVRDSIVVPAMQHVQQVLAEAGEECNVFGDDTHFPGTIVLALYPSAEPRASYTEDNTPKIRFLPLGDYEGMGAQVVIDKLMVYGDRRGEWPLEQVSRPEVDAVLLRFVTEAFQV